jgi:hypothetical protein
MLSVAKHLLGNEETLRFVQGDRVLFRQPQPALESAESSRDDFCKSSIIGNRELDVDKRGKRGYEGFYAQHLLGQRKSALACTRSRSAPVGSENP